MTDETARPIHWAFLALSILCQVIASVFGKLAAQHLGTPTPAAFLTNGWYLAGLGFLLLQAVFWQLVLRSVQLFVAYMGTSLTYVLLLAASRVVFSEHITLLHVAGCGIIAAGVYLLVRDDLA